MRLRLGRTTFAETDLVVMAIINRTPDSFFDKGATFADETAMSAVDSAVAAGAAIVDIGGVKAGPGDHVDVDEELRRTVSFVRAVRERHPGVVISVDTWRASVGAAVVEAGADLLNDAWGGHDPDLARVAGDAGVGLVCTHTGGATPRTRPHRVAYDDVTAAVVEWCAREADRVAGLGVPEESIIVDPGHDFGKNTRHSLQLTRDLGQLVALGRPTLVSLSNKDFVGETLGGLPPEERLTGTLATTAICAWLGARVYRAHQVRPTREVLDMVSTIRGDREPAVARRGLA
ncbi:MAG: dihydropteroate synthase [Frankiaceae bacterium]|nr:dihydropteroate synthase [Frankiaceae bacterium]